MSNRWKPNVTVAAIIERTLDGETQFLLVEEETAEGLRSAGRNYQVTDADAGLSFKTKTFTVKRGERVALCIGVAQALADRGAKLFVTYHPAYLLCDPRQKSEAWKDLQQVMKYLGLKVPAKGSD